jgi:hypothetical protein
MSSLMEFENDCFSPHCLLSLKTNARLYLGVSAVNPLIAFYDIRERKREVIFFYFVSDTTRDEMGVTVYLYSVPTISYMSPTYMT